MNQIQLPSLKHLQLLPNPSIQENSYMYPDTSETTPLWKQNLLNWCKETSYEQYLQINSILNLGDPLPKNIYVSSNKAYQRNDNTHNYTYHSTRSQSHISSENNDSATNVFKERTLPSSGGLNTLAYAAISVLDKDIPTSVYGGKDQFYGLSNTSECDYQGPCGTEVDQTSQRTINRRNISSRTTPPSSPQPQKSNHLVFTPVISDRMIDSIKVNKNTKHKKSNSFKARQMKKILTNRDILNGNSLSVNIMRNTDLQEYREKNMQRLQQMGSLCSPQLTPASNGKTSLPGSASSPLFVSTDAKYMQMPQLLHPQNVMTPPTSPRHTPASNNTYLPVNSPVSAVTTSHIPSQQHENQYNHHHHHHQLPVPPPPLPMPSLNEHVNSSPTRPSIMNKTSPKVSPKMSPKTSPKSRKNSNDDQTRVPRTCISCQSTDSPCWRPSWSKDKHEQLCNSCGLRYKKTLTRCLNNNCKKIPSKGEWSIMKSNGFIQQYVSDPETPNTSALQSGHECLFCGSVTETIAKE